jgi:dGTPase
MATITEALQQRNASDLGTPRLLQERWEQEALSSYAAKSVDSEGRAHPEDPCPLRTLWQRDQDKVIHSKAFRRLKHKTQVFISPVGDHYRTRLTHTLEVTHVSRTIARALRLNEDLTEAIGLGHDIGHPPFGHTGEAALAHLYEGGFLHNLHSIRMATVIEPLNLTKETLDGFANHTGKGTADTLEGQIVKTADRMAYLAHDIDDAIRAGLMSNETLPQDISAVLGQTKSERLTAMVWGMIDGTLQSIREHEATTTPDSPPQVQIAPEVEQAMNALRQWMFKHIYLSPAQQQEAKNVRRVIKGLYEYYCEHPEDISPSIPASDDTARRVVDYIAGMTDRFALDTYTQLYMPKPYLPLSTSPSGSIR